MTPSPPPARPRSRLRRTALALHRYVGLFMAAFLVVAGLTGSVLVFNDELDAAVNPALFDVRGDVPMDPFALQRGLASQLPEGANVRKVRFDVGPGEPVQLFTQDEPGLYRQWFVDPYSGRVRGSRVWGDLSEGMVNLLPFVFRLHYSLVLGLTGTVIFGFVALLWSFDCFVGAYLTMPARPRTARGRGVRTWFARWAPAWVVETRRLFAAVFTGHRAAGLWAWALLFVFAWSGFAFNLPPVHRAVMNTVIETRVLGHESLPQLQAPFPEPTVSLEEAHVLGRAAMDREAERRGFTIDHELELYYAEDHGVYGYVVHSSLDVSAEQPWTEVYVDGRTGETVGFYAQTGIAAGNTVTSWLGALHMGTVFGLGYRLVVMVVGLLVAGLSVTGVWIWWRKRGKRRRAAQRSN